jgi:hypothetical protein
MYQSFFADGTVCDPLFSQNSRPTSTFLPATIFLKGKNNREPYVTLIRSLFLYLTPIFKSLFSRKGLFKAENFRFRVNSQLIFKPEFALSAVATVHFQIDGARTNRVHQGGKESRKEAHIIGLDGVGDIFLCVFQLFFHAAITCI